MRPRDLKDGRSQQRDLAVSGPSDGASPQRTHRTLIELSSQEETANTKKTKGIDLPFCVETWPVHEQIA